MQPSSSDIARPHAEIMAPMSHRRRESPILPVDWAMTPGVAKMPDPITLEMIRTYAEDQLMLLPTALSVDVVISCKLDRLRGVRKGVRRGVRGSLESYIDERDS
jgi:hypothetical protein